MALPVLIYWHSKCIVFGVANTYELSALVRTPVNDQEEFEGVFFRRKVMTL